MTETPETLPVQSLLPRSPSVTPFAFNKAAVFRALETAGITRISINFDGYGDSGQIEDICANVGEKLVPMPDCTIETLTSTWPQSKPTCSSIALSSALEHLAYEVLAQTHCGWENNDGAYGDIIFDTAARTITLDYNERYTTSDNFTHVL